MQSDPRGPDAFRTVVLPAKLQAQGIEPNPDFMTPPSPKSPSPAGSTSNPKPTVVVTQTGGNAGGNMSSKPIACTRCKTKKIKCDGRTPSCSACTRAKEECLIADMVTGRVYPRGYIEKLQNRISELQSLIDTKSREAKESKSRHGSTSSYMDSPMNTDTSTASKRSSATSIQPQSAVEPKFSELQNGEGDLCLARLLVQTLHLKDHGPCISKLSLLVSNDSFQSSQTDFPAPGLPLQQTSEVLLRHYLETEYRCFPFLDETSMLSSIRLVYGLERPQKPSAQDYFRVFMIFAVSALAVSDETDTPTAPGFAYYNSALNYASDLPMMAGIDAIQNLLLLCLFSLNAKVTQDAWKLSRRAIHVCIQEELHLGLEKPPKDGISEEERQAEQLKRRLFWSAYCLNRLASNLLYDRPPSIPEAEIERKPPLEEEDEFIVSSPPSQPGLQLVPARKSLLRKLVRLYHLSTVCFTSFNSSPPKGNVVTKFRHYIQEFIHLKSEAFDNIGESNESLPIYFSLSFYSHHMLICQWAITALLDTENGLPSDVANICISYSMETINMILKACSENRSYYKSRLSFIILLRALFVVVSSLIAPNIEPIGIDITGNRPLRYYDASFAGALEGLLFFGRQFGHGNSYVPALALSLRFGILEQERRVISDQSDNMNCQTKFQSPLSLGLERTAQNSGKQPVEDYTQAYGVLDNYYPRLTGIFRTLGVEKYQLDLNFGRLDEHAGLSAASFRKFGRSAQDLEILSQQVIWRLRVQFGIADDLSLLAFQSRLGTNRPVEPFPQIGGPSPFNATHPGSSGGFAAGEPEGTGEDDVFMAIDSNYQPITEFVARSRGPPKMDVDFSGFETNIISYD